ncbi:hypothetical protein F5X99DRAFT_400299 [Biscogniauxia marginata]|nr:hypothetical protein F5X99DRAFT_400299 [Biscogniauxia marginata]
MDRKLHLRDLPPPPYTPNADPSVSHNQLHPASLTTDLQHHLKSLPDRIHSTQQFWAAQKSLDDSLLLDRLVPIIEDFIASIGSQHTLPLLATLTLVPEIAVPQNAVLSGLEEMQHRDEICLVSRVRVDLNDKDLAKAVSRPTDGDEQRWKVGQEFSDWGRFENHDISAEGSESGREMLWWRDEDMARRLAGYLQPKIEAPEPIETTSLVKPIVKQRPPPQMEKRTWNWVKRKSNRSSETMMNNSDTIVQSKSNTSGKAENSQQNETNRPRMYVTAQEVAFRQENEFGIMESRSGWAVVVTVTITA